MATIILLEDDTLLGEHYSLHLRGAGHAVVTAHKVQATLLKPVSGDGQRITAEHVLAGRNVQNAQ
jgi:hypothetical protein